MTFHSVGNGIIIPTDELHDFSEGLKPPTRYSMRYYEYMGTLPMVLVTLLVANGAGNAQWQHECEGGGGPTHARQTLYRTHMLCTYFKLFRVCVQLLHWSHWISLTLNVI